MGDTYISADGHYIVEPNDIDIQGKVAFLPTKGFGHMPTDAAAARIVRFCQQRNEGWKPFTLKELHDGTCRFGPKCYNRAAGWHTYVFGRLIERRLVIPLPGEKYAITAEFVDICARAVRPDKQ